ncbi:MAG TPA: nitroreductase family protein [Noviherbaspirillum sp.]|uniref:nitroreductase family protein n=1 Tax=Noviherbaspirillum sp. TaxID=1926288 RepID=UPI002D700268|nr:nitroreductase family protein [Noviherbaspirillum sp.]HYD97278.1 nitroreductase family protein [Noviherbaspirillum sp.]
MPIIDTILERRSQPIVEGAIDAAALETIFRCALTAPDHKRIRPWRYIVCNDEHKAALKQLILSTLPPHADAAERAQQVERKLGFAPHIVICALEFNRRCGVPDIEQILSAGASIQNMIVAAEALGCKCYWKTGEWAYNPSLRDRLGLGRDAVITGFLGLGRRAGAGCSARQVERPALDAHFRLMDAPVPQAQDCVQMH